MTVILTPLSAQSEGLAVVQVRLARDADGFAAFKQAEDIFDPETAGRLQEWVYESGGLREADELYRNFRGRDPIIEPLLEGRGFTVD